MKKPRSKTQEEGQSKVDFDDIRSVFDAELEEQARRTSDDDKRKELLNALRNK